MEGMRRAAGGLEDARAKFYTNIDAVINKTKR